MDNQAYLEQVTDEINRINDFTDVRTVGAVREKIERLRETPWTPQKQQVYDWAQYKNITK